MGRTGNALVMLLSHELSYVEFLQLRKVPLVEAELSPSARAEVGGGKGGLGEGLGSDQVLVFLRKEAEADREVRAREKDGIHLCIVRPNLSC